MKKIGKALALGDLVLCLALVIVYGFTGGLKWQQTAVAEMVVEEEAEKEIRRIALTFDDGPHPSYTEELLDGLKERGVHATFFVTGEHAQLHPDIIIRKA